MVETINALIDAAMNSPWAGPAIFLVCLLDAFLPVVPSETTLIAGGVAAASGTQRLAWMVVLAGIGAFLGDHVSYGIGRLLGVRAADRLLRGKAGHALRVRAEHAVRVRGGLMIVAARFIPGGRTATTLAAGTLAYPLLRFSAFAALAAVIWAVYGGLIGYFAGGLFQGNHLLAVTVGIGFSVGLSLIVESTRFALRRRRRPRFVRERASVDAAGRLSGG